MREQWPQIREALLAGTSQPQPVKRVESPKPGGGGRQLGVPTGRDRLIQHAVLQVLQPEGDTTFSASSYGFRPGRSAHQAVAQAQRYLGEGYGWVVDLELEKFFGAPGQAWRFQRVRFPPRQGERAAPPGIESWAHGGNDMG